MSGGLKATREMLCRAQALHGTELPADVADDIARLIRKIDQHRPLGPDGKHGALHTKTCGCEDATPAPPIDFERARRARPCRDSGGHWFVRYTSAWDDTLTWRACRDCLVTETDDDYRIRARADQTAADMLGLDWGK